MTKQLFNTILTIIIFYLSVTDAFAQHNKESREIIIATPDSVVKTYIKETKSDIKANDSRTYYWYYAGSINHNQGGFSGKLLNGSFEVFDKKQSLVTSGFFSNGLKIGTWKKWTMNGIMKESNTYKNGKRNGISRFYNENGKLLIEADYTDDRLDGKSKYYLNDTVIVKKFRLGNERPAKKMKLQSHQKDEKIKNPGQKKRIRKESIKSKTSNEKLNSEIKSDKLAK